MNAQALIHDDPTFFNPNASTDFSVTIAHNDSTLTIDSSRSLDPLDKIEMLVAVLSLIPKEVHKEVVDVAFNVLNSRGLASGV